MKKLTVGLLTTLVVLGTSFAGPKTSGKEMKETVAEPCFKDQELQVDAFGSYTDFRGDASYKDGFGGGLGVNYFYTRYLGVGVDGNVLKGGVNGVWTTTASLILRFPIESCVCVAPYAIAGGGALFDHTTVGTYHVGGGLEFRVIPQKLGLYAEGRYSWPENEPNAQVRAGVRFVF
jgi:hypothetical protein